MDKRMIYPRNPTPILLMALALLVGCGEAGPDLIRVAGQVTWQGEPVEIGQVIFVPTGGGQPAVGEISSDGWFELRSHAGRLGSEPGEYRVAIRAFEGSVIDGDIRYFVPEKFAQIETSQLTAVIPPDGEDSLEFDFHLP